MTSLFEELAARDAYVLRDKEHQIEDVEFEELEPDPNDITLTPDIIFCIPKTNGIYYYG